MMHVDLPCRSHLGAFRLRIDARAGILVAVGADEDGVDGLLVATWGKFSWSFSIMSLESRHWNSGLDSPWKTVIKVK